MNKLASLFSVEPGEGRLVSLLFANSFMLGIANNFVQTAAFALFMVEFDAQMLAWVYVANALAIPAITFVYLRLGNRLSYSRLLAVNLAFLLVLVTACALGLGLTGSRLIVFALPVLFQVVVNFGNLQFWTLAGRLFDVRQGKRLFGLVGAGQWLAIVITGLMIPLLVAWMGTANLLFLAALAVAAALGLVVAITRLYAGGLVVAPAASKAVGEKKSLTSLFKNRYVVLIFVLVVLWWIAFYFIDNVFYDRAAVQFPGEEQLASFLGIWLAGLGVVTLFCNTFLSGQVIGRYGVRVGLWILPVTLVVTTGAMAVVGSIGQAVTLLFGLTLLTKLADLALGFSVDQSARTTLYQPLPPMLRGQAQTMTEGVFQPLASGLAGLALLALGSLFAESLLPTIYVLLLVVGGWLVVAALLGRWYPAMLLRALNKRLLGGADLSLEDASSIAVLERELHSPHPGVVLYALNMLETIGHESLPTFLQEALAHPEPVVRQDALERIERLGVTSALPAVEQCVDQEPVATIRGTAVCTLAALGGNDVLDVVVAYAGDPNPQVKQGALVGLMRSDDIKGERAGSQMLLPMVESAEPQDRIMAAQVLGKAGASRSYPLLASLLRDGDVQVRRAALAAAGQAKIADLWPLVVEGLDSPPVRKEAALSLIAGGESALPEIMVACERPDQSPIILAQLARVCGRIGGDKATAWLLGQLAQPDAEVRTEVLLALHRCGYQAGEGDAGPIQEQIRAEAALSAETLAILDGIGDDEPVALLRGALEAALAGDRRRIYFLLSFLYDRRAVLRARDTLEFGAASADQRAYALEVIDVLASLELKKVFFPLLAGQSSSERAQRSGPRSRGAQFPQPQRERRQRLQEIVDAPPGRFGAWTRACALYAAGLLEAEALEGTLLAALAAPEPLVREAAIYALRRMGGDSVQEQIMALARDPNPQASQAARAALGSMDDTSREERMLSTIEKVLILKKVDIFAQTPDDTLADVAALLEEVPLSAGDQIIKKGDLGDCMYIIVQGEVRVHDGEHTLNHLAEGDLFGEMAVLDPEPRMASVTAVVDSRLLRLAQEPLYELMDDRSEVSRGIIQVLSRHLRARARDLNELRAGQEEPKGSQ